MSGNAPPAPTPPRVLFRPRTKKRLDSRDAAQDAPRQHQSGARSARETRRPHTTTGLSFDVADSSLNSGIKSTSVAPLQGSERHVRFTPRPEKSFKLPPDGEQPFARQVDEEEEKKMERSWYNSEESTVHNGDYDPFEDYTLAYEHAVATQAEGAVAAAAATGARLSKRHRQSTRFTQMLQDTEKWESNRLITSGVGQRAYANHPDHDNDGGERVHVIVKETRPQFLGDIECDANGPTSEHHSFAVDVVRDPTSDLAQFSRKGSEIVRLMRSEKEKRRATQQRTQVAGTVLGNVMGVSETDTVTANDVAELDSSSVSTKVASDNAPAESTSTATAPTAEKKTDAQLAEEQRQHIREQRKSLPVFSVREELLGAIRENQALIVVGETGSGKTTQLTQYLYEAGYARNGIIACTQPRRVAAMSVAKRVSEEMGVTLGGRVGYSIRFEDRTSPETKIKYMTDGILLRELLHDPDVEKYSCIIMDEAHERSLNTDVLMGIMERVLERRRDLKLIVTSATMNAEKFSRFFGNAAIYNIPGRTFPVDILYSKGPCLDYVDAAVKKALSIHLTLPPGDILIFMTGQEDIEATCTIMQDRLDSMQSPPPLTILPIYSQLPADLQNKIFEKSATSTSGKKRKKLKSNESDEVSDEESALPQVPRKCVVATNIAETSLTIDGIIYVIDTGFCKLKYYNSKIGMDALQVTPISQAQANQRAGRAGRCAPGVAFRLYTESAFRDEMHENTIPEILRTNLANVVLLLKSVGVKDLLTFGFMDPPPKHVVLGAMYQLWILGSLDSQGELTELGRRMVSYPLDPSLSKMLIVSEELGCSAEMVSIVSMLSVPTVFYRPKERMDEADAARERFYVPESDHLTLLHVYTQWKSKVEEARGNPKLEYLWCSKSFIQARAMRRADEVRRQLVDIMVAGKRKIDGTIITREQLPSCGSNWDVLRKCICSAYFHHAARLKTISSTNSGSEYLNLRTGLSCHVHPTSALYGLGYTPDYVVYHELIMTTKEYAQCVTSVDPYWLAEMGPMFFSIRNMDSSGNNEKNSDFASAFARLTSTAIEAPASGLNYGQNDKKHSLLNSDNVCKIDSDDEDGDSGPYKPIKRARASGSVQLGRPKSSRRY